MLPYSQSINRSSGIKRRCVFARSNVQFENSSLRGGCIRILPGQYFDAETNLHYNWNRYYDPSTGRYITSDPIGLTAGLNTYGYALQNPVMYYDGSGNSAVHATVYAIRGAWWTGTRIGAGINYGIQAVTGLSLGALLYESFNNEGIDFGDAANDDSCNDPFDKTKCKLVDAEIEGTGDFQGGNVSGIGKTILCIYQCPDLPFNLVEEHFLPSEFAGEINTKQQALNWCPNAM